MDKQAILQASNFGERVAEDESTELEKYFVETDHWKRTFNGDVDVVYGPKGSGKSALYSLLIQRTNALFDRGVMIVSAEKPRGTPIFRDLQQDPPTTEEEFVALWKLYILTLVQSVLKEYGATCKSARQIEGFLADAGLIQKHFDLPRALKSAFRYVRSYFRPPSAVEGTVEVDPMSGIPKGFTGKILFTEPDSASVDLVSVDYLLSEANVALGALASVLWILLDRLDVAFAETPELEENALRALFRVYLDTRDLDRLSLKIFLRTDIWKRITRSGFREASHITRHITIRWDANALLNLVIRRLVKNEAIVDAYNVSVEEVLSSLESQQRFFYRVFPAQVDVGSRKSTAFDWILARTVDGLQEYAPREIVHFLNAARDAQLRQHEIASTEDEGEALFTRIALKAALPEVSRVRLHQTLFAEYPSLQQYVEKLKGDKASQHSASLSRIWQLDAAESLAIADQLVDVGFFERRGTREEPAYWVPFLYRDAADVSQGTADSD